MGRKIKKQKQEKRGKNKIRKKKEKAKIGKKVQRNIEIQKKV